MLPLLGTPAGRAEHGLGAGGDRTLELDLRAEQAAVAELRGLAGGGTRFSVLSEETGLLDFGAEYPRVLVDPVDGSRNAKRALPVVGLMLALLGGPTLASTEVGFVGDLVSGERWHAVRGGGAYRNGRRLAPLAPAPEEAIELLALEGAPRDLWAVRRLLERAVKLRQLGSMALALAHTAGGGIDVHCSPSPVRVFDTAASALMVSEVGGRISDLAGRPFQELGAGLETRSTLLASAQPRLHELALRLADPAQGAWPE